MFTQICFTCSTLPLNKSEIYSPDFSEFTSNNSSRAGQIAGCTPSQRYNFAINLSLAIKATARHSDIFAVYVYGLFNLISCGKMYTRRIQNSLKCLHFNSFSLQGGLYTCLELN